MKWLCVVVLGLSACGGCQWNPMNLFSKPPKYGDMEKGLVIVLPGIEGRSSLNEDICQGLHDGGVPFAIQLYDWTSMWGPLYTQRAEGRNRDQAAEIALKIVRYKRAYPKRPVFLIGQSGGGAMAIWTAEALPPGYSVDGVILMAASLSPGYPLDIALAKTRQGVISYYSSRDWVLLGIGTTVVGTMDGEHTSSAGKTGFEVPGAGGVHPSVYGKLFQIPWQPQMASTGYRGTHLSSGAGRFVASYVAPFLETTKWDDDVVARVLRGDSVAAGKASQPSSGTHTP